MIKKEINNISQNKNILIVPLDWGLGHATRCIPLIKEFQANGCRVIIGAENAVKALLEHEFQDITIIPLKGYRVRYSRKRYWLPLKIVSQLPHILLGIYREHQWVKKVTKKYDIHAILADNRFGLYQSGIKSIYITHQLLIKTGSNFTEKIVQKIHFWIIKKFTSCWVPDYEGTNNIAGELSNPGEYSPNVSYIGCLSRFEVKGIIERKYDLLILISGPEPQRAIFEQLLLLQLQNYPGYVLLVRGLPGHGETADKSLPECIRSPNLIIKNHLSSQELNDAIQQSGLVISRSGYTTIMDLIKLRQKAILVPTPGQTEQEYLASYLMKQHLFYTVSQHDFSLTKVVNEAASFPFSIPLFNMGQYKNAVFQFVQTL